MNANTFKDDENDHPKGKINVLINKRKVLKSGQDVVHGKFVPVKRIVRNKLRDLKCEV